MMSAGSVKPGASGDFDAVLAIGARPVRIDEVLALARGSLRAELDGDPAQRDKLARSRAAVERALETRGGEVYGVTTGVGASADVSIPTELRGDLPS